MPSRFSRRSLLLASALLGMLAAPRAQRTTATYDVVVRHGTILDGSGGAPYRADVAITGGRIVRVGDLSAARAAVDLEARDLDVAPGFINIHSHAQRDALPRAENMLTQGVTTEILNPDGGGAIDIAGELADDAGNGLAVNIGAYIGFNSVWAQVVGPANRRPGPDELEQMRALIVDGLQHGAWGVSAGLDYKPAYFATTDEVVSVVQAAKRWRTDFTNHDRLTPESHFSSHAGVAETIAIGERAGLVPIVTHMKAQGHEQGTAGVLLGMMSAATRRGHYTAADVYPYLAGQSGLGALIIPGWAQDGGREAMLQRFKDPALHAKIVAEAEDAMKARFGGPQGVYLPASQRELTDVMREMGVSGGEAVVRLLEQDDRGAILRFGAEPDLIRILQHPTASIACDCGATNATRTHPRMWGTFPRVLGRYVREKHVLTWENAIRKMTALPASTIGLVDRGRLAPGMAADITVFDPKTVIDHSTYEEPTLRSDGIRFVLVNGELAVRDGAVTGARGGRVLVRAMNMPSRPMNASGARRVTAHGTIAGHRLALAVTQPAGAHRAQGIFRLADPSGATIEATTLGVLQTAGNWASITGVARLQPSGETRSITVIVDGADPAAGNDTPIVTVQIDGHESISGPLAAGAARISPRVLQ
ncbi:MAG: amidohydrolase family protein [Betaproteobacteria bacterium]